MSADLQWAILRNNSCFLVKKDGYEFTSEPGNLNQKNSFKFSGLANTKAISIKAAAKGVAFSTKVSGINKVSKAFTKPAEMKKGSRSSAQAIKKFAQVNHYRPDLITAAMGRVSAIHSSQKPLKPLKKKKVRSTKKN